MKFIPAACLALLLPWGCAQAGQACLAPAGVSTDGVHLGDSDKAVRSHLGQPLKVVAGSGEDDGGRYPTRSLAFQSLTVILGHDRVESIEIHGTRRPVAAGLVVGGPVGALKSPALVDHDHPARGAAFGLRLCGDDGTSNTGLSIFVAEGRVTRAVLYGYGP
jgi:hypothetical protein